MNQKKNQPTPILPQSDYTSMPNSDYIAIGMDSPNNNTNHQSPSDYSTMPEEGNKEYATMPNSDYASMTPDQPPRQSMNSGYGPVLPHQPKPTNTPPSSNNNYGKMPTVPSDKTKQSTNLPPPITQQKMTDSNNNYGKMPSPFQSPTSNSPVMQPKTMDLGNNYGKMPSPNQSPTTPMKTSNMTPLRSSQNYNKMPTGNGTTTEQHDVDYAGLPQFGNSPGPRPKSLVQSQVEPDYGGLPSQIESDYGGLSGIAPVVQNKTPTESDYGGLPPNQTSQRNLLGSGRTSQYRGQ